MIVSKIQDGVKKSHSKSPKYKYRQQLMFSDDKKKEKK